MGLACPMEKKVRSIPQIYDLKTLKGKVLVKKIEKKDLSISQIDDFKILKANVFAKKIEKYLIFKNKKKKKKIFIRY